MPCPHCDRVFKQADRLKQHIQKQHADEAAAADPGTSSSSSGSAAAAQQPPKVLAPAAVAAVGAAAAAAVKSVAAAGKPGKGDSKGTASAGNASSTSGTAPAPAAAAAAAAPKLMDIGSRAGYYEAKSPKLLLHEWCLREKAPRPRYRASQAEGGLWKCKVGGAAREQTAALRLLPMRRQRRAGRQRSGGTPSLCALRCAALQQAALCSPCLPRKGGSLPPREAGPFTGEPPPPPPVAGGAAPP